MHVFRGFHHRGIAPACALTIGNFDGVHRGHQAMLALVHSEAQHRGLPVAVLTFEPHPRDHFARKAGRPELAPARLVTLRDKLSELERCGVDQVVETPVLQVEREPTRSSYARPASSVLPPPRPSRSTVQPALAFQCLSACQTRPVRSRSVARTSSTPASAPLVLDESRPRSMRRPRFIRTSSRRTSSSPRPSGSSSCRRVTKPLAWLMLKRLQRR